MVRVVVVGVLESWLGLYWRRVVLVLLKFLMLLLMLLLLLLLPMILGLSSTISSESEFI